MSVSVALSFCDAVAPNRACRCRLMAPHDGPHDCGHGYEWNDGDAKVRPQGNCESRTGGGRYGCQREAGHRGKHRNGGVTWTDADNAPTPDGRTHE